jgi:hypothetical protein
MITIAALATITALAAITTTAAAAATVTATLLADTWNSRDTRSDICSDVCETAHQSIVVLGMGTRDGIVVRSPFVTTTRIPF